MIVPDDLPERIISIFYREGDIYVSFVLDPLVLTTNPPCEAFNIVWKQMKWALDDKRIHPDGD